jgi:hypothetical protein
MHAAGDPRNDPRVRAPVPVKTRRRQRARVGEQPAQGEVRPVTTRTLVLTGAGVLLLVASATTAILVASVGTKKRVTTTTNLPHGLASSATRSYVGSYQETVELPTKHEIVVATITLLCAQACDRGRYSGYAGGYEMKVRGTALSGTAHPSCQSDFLALRADSALKDAELPQSLAGTLTRTSTCPGTAVASPVSLRLHRTH